VDWGWWCIKPEADGSTIDNICIGKIDVLFIQKDGTRIKKTLAVKVARAIKHSLFSFTAAMLNGWTMLGKH
jgi:hypothetical protein